jgi:hypothetical protein
VGSKDQHVVDRCQLHVDGYASVLLDHINETLHRVLLGGGQAAEK